jgi:hypothetical protein
MLIQEAEVTIDNGIHKQAVSDYPLFIAPIARGLLGNQVSVRRTLIFHPGQGFPNSILKEIMFSRCFPVNTNRQ